MSLCEQSVTEAAKWIYSIPPDPLAGREGLAALSQKLILLSALGTSGVAQSAYPHLWQFYESALNDHESAFRNITKTHEKNVQKRMEKV